jgi:hypothetical protein
VLLRDRFRYGLGTLSTHALMRGACCTCAGWGCSLPSSRREPRPFGRQPSTCRTPTRTTVQIKPRLGVDALYAPRHPRRDPRRRRPQRRRDRAGRVTGITGEAGAADLEVGADGRRSTIARCVGATAARVAPTSSAVIYRYFRDDAIAGYHWHYAARSSCRRHSRQRGPGLRVRRHQRNSCDASWAAPTPACAVSWPGSAERADMRPSRGRRRWSRT